MLILKYTCLGKPFILLFLCQPASEANYSISYILNLTFKKFYDTVDNAIN